MITTTYPLMYLLMLNVAFTLIFTTVNIQVIEYYYF